MRDHQKSKVYAWEKKFVAPHDKTMIPIGSIEPMVRAIWTDLGLLYPPNVEELPKNSRNSGDATRLTVRFKRYTPSWIILHELAHSLTMNHNGYGDKHGADFVGMYVQLLVRYMRLSQDTLLSSLMKDGIRVNIDAKPLFIP